MMDSFWYLHPRAYYNAPAPQQPSCTYILNEWRDCLKKEEDKRACTTEAITPPKELTKCAKYMELFNKCINQANRKK